MDEDQFSTLCANIDALLGAFQQRTAENGDPRLVDCCTRLVGFYRLLRNNTVAHGAQLIGLREDVDRAQVRIKELEVAMVKERERTDSCILKLERNCSSIVDYMNEDDQDEEDRLKSIEEDVVDLSVAVGKLKGDPVAWSNYDKENGEEIRTSYKSWKDTKYRKRAAGMSVSVVDGAGSGVASAGVNTPPSEPAPVDAPVVSKRRKYELRSKGM